MASQERKMSSSTFGPARKIIHSHPSQNCILMEIRFYCSKRRTWMLHKAIEDRPRNFEPLSCNKENWADIPPSKLPHNVSVRTLRLDRFVVHHSLHVEVLS
ncbi:hypothetical protein TNCV_3991241 [Trichonephila clavipes]|uniref:Uncharacterized protein n=1 Tax=Trichonephila clavipes TaxID=2585209 RepID=A0A8X6VT55_TRICX|nr:hypothetical protein TNCV_3991241 [Trichonephila clavipes]